MIKFLQRSLALFNAIEGFSHIAFSLITIWGIFATSAFDWRVTMPAVLNLLLGIFSVFTGYVIIFNKSKIIRKIVAILNTIEGSIHIIVAFVGFWGIFVTWIFDWRLFATPVEHLVFGIFSILTGYIMGDKFHNHHHH